jgi:hypothetical protein
MKKFLSILFIATISIIAGCRKNDNPKIPQNIFATPIAQLIQDPASTVLIQDVASFASKFSVQLYFKTGVKPKKMDIVVAMSGNYNVVKTLKADVNTYPTDISVTGPELAALFGLDVADVVPGDFFEIRANMTLDNGTILPGFVPRGITPDGDTVEIAPYGTDASTFPGSNVTITYRAVCPLVMDDFVGNFTADDELTGTSYPVTLARSGDDKIVVTGYGGASSSPAGVFTLTVDANTQTAEVPSQKFTDILDGYHNATVDGSGVVDACNVGLTFTMNVSVDEGSFNPAKLVIHK